MSSGNHSKLKLMSMFVAMVVVITTIAPVVTIIVTTTMDVVTVIVTDIVPAIMVVTIMIIITTKDIILRSLSVNCEKESILGMDDV